MTKPRFLVPLLPVITLVLLVSCGSGASGTHNYFAETEIGAPHFGSVTVNKHLKEFGIYYNELATAVTVKNKEALPELSRLFSDWIIKAVSLRETLPPGEQNAFDSYLAQTNKVWDEQKNQLL
ncbi:hypothetical protein [Taibaiella koreensis]|uniref:hypothetical protein n=1 Tax=Taibaiella koreensis TaxID=1268548 RepID=UPI000E59FE0D|nr:hypothetical protein [Taibaiella koreensis]